MAAEQAQQGDYVLRWSEIMARARASEAFKERLLADPRTVLLEHGFPMPPVQSIDTSRLLGWRARARTSSWSSWDPPAA